MVNASNTTGVWKHIWPCLLGGTLTNCMYCIPTESWIIQPEILSDFSFHLQWQLSLIQQDGNLFFIFWNHPTRPRSFSTIEYNEKTHHYGRPTLVWIYFHHWNITLAGQGRRHSCSICKYDESHQPISSIFLLKFLRPIIKMALGFSIFHSPESITFAKVWLFLLSSQELFSPFMYIHCLSWWSLPHLYSVHGIGPSSRKEAWSYTLLAVGTYHCGNGVQVLAKS